MRINENNILRVSRKMKIFNVCFFIIICSILFASLTGCTTRSGDYNEVKYYNEKYGFTLLIPNDYYKNLKIEEKSIDDSSRSINFIYNETNENGTGFSGILFKIFVFSKTYKENDFVKNNIKVLGENNNYKFGFWTITEPIENMSFEKFYTENKNEIIKIADTFKLD